MAHSVLLPNVTIRAALERSRWQCRIRVQSSSVSWTTLTLYDTPMRVTSENQLDTDLLHRYQQNLQEFFDSSASLPTYFAENEQPHAP